MNRSKEYGILLAVILIGAAAAGYFWHTYPERLEKKYKLAADAKTGKELVRLLGEPRRKEANGYWYYNDHFKRPGYDFLEGIRWAEYDFDLKADVKPNGTILEIDYGYRMPRSAGSMSRGITP